MSECVVRMKVPENCYECDVYLSAFINCPVYSVAFGYQNRHKYIKCRHPDCPIGAILPEGHGRLGDLDELERKINGARIRAMQDGQDTNPYWECGDIIASEKTIVPAERSET